jgi:hypothetical protein
MLLYFFGLSHRVAVGDIVDVSEIYAASIFIVELPLSSLLLKH